MYGTTRARRMLTLALALGLLALALGLKECLGTPLARYAPFVGALAPRSTPAATTPAQTPAPTPGPPAREQVIALVQAYNQADVAANRANDLSRLLPYVHPNGPLYASLAAEYRRRIAAGEVHNVQLTRFWAAEPSVSATETEIVIETQEVWDETVVDNRTGQVLSAQVGIVTHQRYTIRPDAGGVWRIWDLELVDSGGYTP